MKAILLASAVLLTACGGGGGSDTPAAPLPVAALYGDSTQLADYSDISPTSEAQRHLSGLAQLRNEGVNGTTAQQLRDGADGKHPEWTKEMQSSPAKVVMVNHAINDYNYPLADYREYLHALVNIARDANKRVILETPNPITAASFDLAAFEQRVITMREVAAEMKVPLCDQHAAIVAAGLVNETIDGIHPNSRLYAFKGQIAAECIRPLL